jgi:parallel beta-helix repeat protein
MGMRLARLAVLAALGVGILAAAPAAEARTCDRIAGPNRHLRTPKQLLSHLHRGQVGCLKAGTYSSNQTVIRTRGVTLRSYPGERATLLTRLVVGANRVRVSGLNLDGSNGAPCRRSAGCYPGEDTLPSPTVNGAHVRISANDITNRHGICVGVRGYYGLQPDFFRIERNRIHDCRPATNHIHGIYITSGRGGLIRDNVIYNNGDKGIVMYPDARGTRIEHNTIDGNRTGVHFGGDSVYASRGNVVRGNVIANPASRDGRPARFNVDIHWDGPVGTRNVVTGNCLFTPLDDKYFRGRPPASGVQPDPAGVRVYGNVVGDPRYLNRDAADFRVDPEGPCAGYGADAAIGDPAATTPKPASRQRIWRVLLPSLRKAFATRF